MLIGEYQHGLDTKGRLFMPAKFRDEIGDKFIITKGLDDCLFVFSLKEWGVLEKKLREVPFTNQKGRAFVRFFVGGAAECEPDKQGRFLIPANLRQHAKLEKEAVIIGVSTRAEIWSKDLWEEYSKAEESKLADYAMDFDLNFSI